MLRESATRRRDIGQLVETQMRNWEIARAQKTEDPVRTGEQEVQQFIAISRAVGLPGYTVAEHLHERLGWPIFDREILNAMAENNEYRRRVYAQLDQRDVSWLEDSLRAVVQGHFSQEAYLHRLIEAVFSLARKGHAIFLGRGTDLILPVDLGLRVRLTADHDYCVGGLAKMRNLSYQAAMHQVDVIEQERADFVRRSFRVAPDDENRFDIILNLRTFTVPQVVDFIMEALRFRGIVD